MAKTQTHPGGPVATTLNYNCPETPYDYYPGTAAAYTMPWDSVSATINDARGREDDFGLDKAGFGFVKHGSKCVDGLLASKEKEWVEAEYYPEIAELLKNVYVFLAIYLCLSYETHHYPTDSQLTTPQQQHQRNPRPTNRPSRPPQRLRPCQILGRLPRPRIHRPRPRWPACARTLRARRPVLHRCRAVDAPKLGRACFQTFQH